ncbi:pectinesterase family protein [Paenibacillus sp. KS-LC4]|uniref:pectinesterase family protein n=1 Tax=Paenibacillus sp. KS-LC4 TaxID=2979727 RepID=UPI0030D4F920
MVNRLWNVCRKWTALTLAGVMLLAAVPFSAAAIDRKEWEEAVSLGALSEPQSSSVSEEGEIKSWAQKDFSLQIGNVIVKVTGALSAESASSLTIPTGLVHYAKSESASISLDLSGNELDDSDVTNLSTAVVSKLAIVPGTNELVATFVDQTTYPAEYRVHVEDQSVLETPSSSSDYLVGSDYARALGSPPDVKVQPDMPAEIDPDNTLTVVPQGQRLIVGHTNGNANIGSLSGISYYVFDAREDAATIEADIQIKSVGNSSNKGVFFGMFDSGNSISRIATIGVRGNKTLRNVYSKSGSPNTPSAGSMDLAYQIGDTIRMVNQKRAGGWYSEATLNKQTYSALIEYRNIALDGGAAANLKYGFAFSNVEVVIRNLMFKDEQGNVLYDQNDAYAAIGEAPTATGIAQPVLSEDRTKISLSWNGDTPSADDDAAYVVEMSTDGGATYKMIADQLKDKFYTAVVEGSGHYQFKVYGIAGAIRTEPVISATIAIVEPLEAPVAAIESGDGKLMLHWNTVHEATTYAIYRRSSDQSEYVLLAKDLMETIYTDTDVVNETPYYYYVVASSASNSSNGSVPVLSVPSAGHKGEYVYEDAAAELFITKKSYDTVFANKATLEGVVDRSGTLRLLVNGAEQEQVHLKPQEAFGFRALLNEGRNDVSLLFTDQSGNTTRSSFNFVYLTHYDAIVDAAHQGPQGALSGSQPGVKLYSTVQAAVDAVPAGNTERIVILIKEGSYDEHLRIAAPNISLIGEDRDQVNINFYDSVLSPEGGSTAERNAVYVLESAANFSAENLTFENTYPYLGDGSKSNESADALRVDADQSTFVHVKLLGYQDTLYASKNRQYYYKSYILGNVDFIYGDAQALFNDSDIVFRYHAAKNSGYVTAPRTAADKSYGYIFNNSRIMAEEGASGTKYLLARPWGPDGAATFINMYMSGIVNKQAPYTDMSGNLAVKARFNEYYTYGDGFAIHSGRPQISKTQAENMLTPSFLGWNPYETVTARAQGDYIGNMTTVTEEKFTESTYVFDKANPNSTNDTGLGRYALEGYAASRQVTGGGLLLETSENYHKAATAEQLLSALAKAKNTGKATVIELLGDIALGSEEIGDEIAKYGRLIQPAQHQPLMHPTLIKSGISTLRLEGMSGLTIFSQNGAKLTHVKIEINGSSNIIIRNLVFDELWEWDEQTGGDYDRNDWDYITIQEGSTGIWIDHSTFYKAYDGIVDIKKAVDTDTSDVTISWSRFLPESEGSFFNDMMALLEASPEQYPYYNKLLTEYDMTKAQARSFAAAQKKTHLIGASDTEANQRNLRITLANNYYLNSMDRMPRLRAGSGHVYNTIMDASALLTLRQSLTNELAQPKVVSNGAISTVGASVLIENSDIRGIVKALLSGNGSSPAGHIGALNTLYTMNGVPASLTITDESQAGLTLDATAFKSKLPYRYQLYDAGKLNGLVLPYAGAGRLKMLPLQWAKTSYNDSSDPTQPTAPSGGGQNGNNPGSGSGGTSGGTSTSASSSGVQASIAQIKASFEKLSDEEQQKVVTSVEEFLPYTWSSEQGLTVALLALLTNQVFTNEELAVIAANPVEALKALGIQIEGRYRVLELPTASSASFKDVNDRHWALDSIREATRLGLASGMPNGTFAPNQSLRTADAFTFLDRVLMRSGLVASSLPRSTVERYVTDKSHWSFYAKASIGAKLSEQTLRAVSSLGEEPITRELLAQVLYEATGGRLDPVRDAQTFADIASSPYREGIEYSVRAGLLNGVSASTMEPDRALTRAEMIAIIVRLSERLS